MTSNKWLEDFLGQVARGELDADTARDRLIETFRARPFEDLGFARVDHHRAIRQGFPEVILGLGKTPAQISAIAAEIVSRGSTLLVTRANEAAFDAVRLVVPGAVYHAEARLITLRQNDVAPGKGTPDDWRKEVAFWKKAGCSHVLAHTTFTSAIHERIKGKTYDDHLKAITQYREAVKDLL